MTHRSKTASSDATQKPFREIGGCRGLCAVPENEHGAIGALLIRIGFWGALYYNYNKEPPK